MTQQSEPQNEYSKRYLYFMDWMHMMGIFTKDMFFKAFRRKKGIWVGTHKPAGTTDEKLDRVLGKMRMSEDLGQSILYNLFGYRRHAKLMVYWPSSTLVKYRGWKPPQKVVEWAGLDFPEVRKIIKNYPQAANRIRRLTKPSAKAYRVKDLLKALVDDEFITLDDTVFCSDDGALKVVSSEDLHAIRIVLGKCPE